MNWSRLLLGFILLFTISFFSTPSDAVNPNGMINLSGTSNSVPSDG